MGFTHYDLKRRDLPVYLKKFRPIPPHFLLVYSATYLRNYSIHEKASRECWHWHLKATRLLLLCSVCKVIVFPTFLGSSPTIHNCHFPFGIPVNFWWYLKNPGGLITILNFSYPTLTKSVEFTPLLLLCIIFNRRSSPKNLPQKDNGHFFEQEKRNSYHISEEELEKKCWKAVSTTNSVVEDFWN